MTEEKNGLMMLLLHVRKIAHEKLWCEAYDVLSGSITCAIRAWYQFFPAGAKPRVKNIKNKSTIKQHPLMCTETVYLIDFCWDVLFRNCGSFLLKLVNFKLLPITLKVSSRLFHEYFINGRNKEQTQTLLNLKFTLEIAEFSNAFTQVNEITALHHKILDYSVKRNSLVSNRYSITSENNYIFIWTSYSTDSLINSILTANLKLSSIHY